MAGELVLVVDDDEQFRELLRLHLTACGCEVEEAASAEVALERVATRPPALVLSDLRMDGMDGVELRDRLTRSHPHVPVRVWSALPPRGATVLRKGLAALETLLADLRAQPAAGRALRGAPRG